ncbi:phenylpyruvate tautomerase MIF-related protein [Desulforhopalus sp. 52FAK]
MPYFKIETNLQLGDAEVKNFVQKSSRFMAELLQKPEKWVMVSYGQSNSMSFNASNSSCAYLTIKSIGLDVAACTELSSKICTYIEGETGINPDRMYLDFQVLEREQFGWNGKTF